MWTALPWVVCLSRDPAFYQGIPFSTKWYCGLQFTKLSRFLPSDPVFNQVVQLFKWSGFLPRDAISCDVIPSLLIRWFPFSPHKWWRFLPSDPVFFQVISFSTTWSCFLPSDPVISGLLTELVQNLHVWTSPWAFYGQIMEKLEFLHLKWTCLVSCLVYEFLVKCLSSVRRKTMLYGSVRTLHRQSTDNPVLVFWTGLVYFLSSPHHYLLHWDI